jgi:5S rRNA maturation endonuclease (ribonuclease M5)
MNFHGRQIDPVALWSEFTSIPESRHKDSPFIHGLWCPNPDHANSRNPGPFQINVTQPTVHCFGECGISGSYEHAIAVIKGLTNARGERNRYAARKIILRLTAGHRVRPNREFSDNGARRGSKRKSVTAISDLEFQTFIPPVGIEYLDRRGIDGSSIGKWGLGWDGDRKRIVIPARDEKDVLRFLIRRAVLPRDQPKYLYSDDSEKTSLLFGACMLDRDRVRSSGLVVVEGSLDTICLHQNNVTNAVGQLGSKLSERQRDIIRRYRPSRIYLFFDKNAAGVRATRAARDLLRSYPIFVCLYPKGKDDPAQLSRKEAQKAIEKAVPYARFRQRMKNVTPHVFKEEVTSVG